MENINDTFLVFSKNDGVFRGSLALTSMGDAESVLSVLAGRIPLSLTNVAQVRGFQLNLICKQQPVIWAELPTLQLHMGWTVNGDKLVPNCDFANPAVRTWQAPKDMHLRFCLVLDRAANGVCTYMIPVLLALSDKQPGMFKLPMPNIYEDGRVCMGHDYRAGGLTMIDRFFHALDRFMSSTYNADLAPPRDKMWAMFSYNADGTQCEIQSDWESLCDKTASAYLV